MKYLIVNTFNHDIFNKVFDGILDTEVNGFIFGNIIKNIQCV